MAVEVSVREICGELEITALEPGSGSISFQTPEISRPGLQFTGFYEKFSPKRVQLIGNAEMYYLYSLTPEQLADRMERFMGLHVPCIVCARGNKPPEILLEKARHYGVPVFITNRTTDRVGHEISSFIQKKLARRILLHGELMDIYGTGVLIRGESGLGKSETALELIKRGHRLIADDAVEVKRISRDTLVGCAPELIRYYMELRGIGVINVRHLYGMGAVKPETNIDLVVSMEPWEDGKAYDRLGLTNETASFLGVSLPQVTIPVRPGRNLAVIMELAAMNNRQKKMGYNAAEALTAEHDRAIDLGLL